MYSAAEEAEIQRLITRLQPHALRTERAMTAACGEKRRRRIKLREIQRGIWNSFCESDDEEAPRGALASFILAWIVFPLLWAAIKRLAIEIWNRLHD